MSSRTYAPKVSGTLIQDGGPVANAEIILTASFTAAKASARTDSEGRFLVGPLSETQFTRRVFGDRVYVYKLDIRVAGEQSYPGFEGHGMGDPPSDLEVACDLSKPIRQGKSVSYCSPKYRTAPERK
ncbi:MAG: carboxypeptidase-like regulatory domain-containing protein [Thermodesulfobacteriota bacterium]